MRAIRESAENVSEIIACIMWGPKTFNEIHEATGVTQTTVKRWIHAFRKSGLVRIVEHIPREGKGGRSELRFGWQSKPFEFEDV